MFRLDRGSNEDVAIMHMCKGISLCICSMFRLDRGIMKMCMVDMYGYKVRGMDCIVIEYVNHGA